MRTAFVALLFVLCLPLFLSPECRAQSPEEAAPDSLKEPFSGFYINFGVKLLPFPNLDAHIKELGLGGPDDPHVVIGLTYEFSRTNKRQELSDNERISAYYFHLANAMRFATDTRGDIEGWGIMSAGVVPFVSGQSTRFGLILGVGFEWTTLTIEKETAFDNFIISAQEYNTSASRFSIIIQPGLRFDYRFELFEDPVILGMEAGYSWDIQETTWGNGSLIGAPDDSNNGFYGSFSVGIPLER